MLISHISDLHLGYSQFNLEEREEDVYGAFQQAIDVSIREGAKLVILSGDLFHTPRPCGKAIITLGNALKKLREKEIPAAFVLGEHDISRLRDVPFAHIYSNLGLAKKLKVDEPFIVNNCAVFGADKERRTNTDDLIMKLQRAGQAAKRHGGKKILVLHQGLKDFNKFAGEVNSTDLPPGFDYYAMGHYHDHMEKRFDYLGGLLAYPGSIDLTPSEGIKEVDKGFILADLSGSEAATQWVKLDRRQQFSLTIDYKDIARQVDRIIEKAQGYGRKPVASIKVSGADIDSKTIAANLVRLNEACLHYVWQPLEEHMPATAYNGRPADIDGELYKLSVDALGSEEMAKFAINDILPLAAQGDASSVLQIVWEAYKKQAGAR